MDIRTGARGPLVVKIAHRSEASPNGQSLVRRNYILEMQGGYTLDIFQFGCSQCYGAARSIITSCLQVLVSIILLAVEGIVSKSARCEDGRSLKGATIEPEPFGSHLNSE